MPDFRPYEDAIRRCCPGVNPEQIRPILDGWDFIVFEVADELMFRFPRRADGHAQLDKETRLLPVIAPALSVRVPCYELFGNDGASDSMRFVGYRKIPGLPLSKSRLEGGREILVTCQLGRFLSELHGLPMANALEAGISDVSATQWRQEYVAFYELLSRRVFSMLPTDMRTRARILWEEFLMHDANCQFATALIHRDLGAEHILCDHLRGELVGVIDWGDACIGDPAIDFAGLLSACGADFVQQVLKSYQRSVDGAFWGRVVFYSRIAGFYWLLYGLDTQSETHVADGLQQLGSTLAT